ncbi:MAG: hypothetical protein HYW57_03345 [Ignavibacteriales bacterium]|nr:hypothetical protein [Ignavibacteriales bacterium]
MGQQNLLIIVVGILIVGVAITVAIAMFRGNSIETSRNNLIVDLGFYAQKAREYYWKPRGQGGGGNSFEGVRIDNLAYKTENENGRYYVESSTQNELILVGVGRMISGEDSIRVKMRVMERQNLVEVVN